VDQIGNKSELLTTNLVKQGVIYLSNFSFLSFRLLQDEGIVREDNQASLQQENTSLRATISRQSQKIGKLEIILRKNDLQVKDQNEDLNDVIERQRERIQQYQQEMEQTKHHMARLEDLVHRVQEQSMKEHVNATPSVSKKRSNQHSFFGNEKHVMPRHQYVEKEIKITSLGRDNVNATPSVSRKSVTDIPLRRHNTFMPHSL
jgi:seryl-tRNA synthetase